MGIFKSGGVVIAVKDSGETSRLADVFTEQYGLIRVKAKGARRPESRFGAATDQLTYIQGVYYMREDENIAGLSAADVIMGFPNIHKDLIKFSYASGLAEVLSANLPAGQPQKVLFNAFLSALKDLEDIDKEIIEKFFWAHLLKFMSLLGYRPEFLICSGCSVGKSSDWMFSVENGRIYCKDCSKSLRDSLFIQLDGGEARILSIFISADRSVLSGLNVSDSQMKTARAVIDAFRKYHTLPENELKSLRFMDQVTKERTES